MRTHRIRFLNFATLGALMLAVGTARTATAQNPATRANHGLASDQRGRDTEAAPRSARPQDTDSVQIARVVHAYHDAEKNADTTTMLSLLSDDVVILESGGSESKADFRAHHMAADIAFARSARVERGALRLRVRGDAAWVSSTSTVERQSNGQPVTSTGAELMVLAREKGSWKITAIHWSSRQRRSPS